MSDLLTTSCRSLLPDVLYFLAEVDIFDTEDNVAEAADAGLFDLARMGRLVSASSRAVRVLRIVKLLRPIFNVDMLPGRRKKEPEAEASSDLASQLDKFVTKHSMICIFAMLALTMGLAMVYGCNPSAAIDLALKGYMYPLQQCLFSGLAGGRGALGETGVDDKCSRDWGESTMPELLRRFEESGHPLVYLKIGQTTLHGEPNAYRASFREHPTSYKFHAYQLWDEEREVNTTVVAHVGMAQQVKAQSIENLCTIAAVLSIFLVLACASSNTMKHELIGACCFCWSCAFVGSVRLIRVILLGDCVSLFVERMQED